MALDWRINTRHYQDEEPPQVRRQYSYSAQVSYKDSNQSFAKILSKHGCTLGRNHLHVLEKYTIEQLVLELHYILFVLR